MFRDVLSFHCESNTMIFLCNGNLLSCSDWSLVNKLLLFSVIPATATPLSTKHASIGPSKIYILSVFSVTWLMLNMLFSLLIFERYFGL